MTTPTPTKPSSIPEIATKLRLIDQLPTPRDVAKEDSNIGIHDYKVNDPFIGRGL